MLEFGWKRLKSLILFSEASPKHARIMKRCLDLFCKALGQTVNVDEATPSNTKQIIL
ncbi:hypothetical protein GBA52_010824 [Prunus armeniaca]|nr:hypothetical protein GBA52_010824 [Prunus armeniaca]